MFNNNEWSFSSVVSVSSLYIRRKTGGIVVEECYGWTPVKVPQEDWKHIR